MKANNQAITLVLGFDIFRTELGEVLEDSHMIV